MVFSDAPAVAVHFRGEISDEESRRDLARFIEFATAYRGLQRRLGHL